MIRIKELKNWLKTMTKIGLFSGLMLYAVNAFSQQTLPQSWDLQTCIDYALANNIQVKTTEENKKNAETDTKLARAAYLPSLSAFVNQNLTNYPFPNIDAGTSSVTGTGSYSINASWQLFDGGVRSTNIKQTDINDEIAGLSIEESKNNIKLAIIQNYLQILYASESVKTFENAVNLSAAQLESNQLKLEIGAVAKSDVSQWESQLASDKYQLVNAQISLDNYTLQLKQLLELDTLETINIVLAEPTEEDVLSLLPARDVVFQTAMKILPQVKSGELNTQYAELSIARARAGFFPTISLNVGSGTGNIYDNAIENFGMQLKNNWNNTIGLSVSIPIYSNREAKSAVEKAQVSVNTARLNELSIYKELYASVETAYLNALNSQAQYLAAQEKVKSSQESYKVMDEQFKLGLKNTIELLTEKNTLVSAQQELLQAKYTALMNRKVLDYYQGFI